MDGKTALGASSPANPALHMPEPLSTTKAATSSSHIFDVYIRREEQKDDYTSDTELGLIPISKMLSYLCFSFSMRGVLFRLHCHHDSFHICTLLRRCSFDALKDESVRLLFRKVFALNAKTYSFEFIRAFEICKFRFSMNSF